MKTTQKEIARKAGVSQCTVSNVFRGVPNNNVSKSTLQTVLSLAKQMGYQQRFVPVENTKNKTRTIGHYFSHIDTFFTSPYYARFLTGVTDCAKQNNYNITIFNSYDRLMQTILRNHLDGVILESRGPVEEIRTIAKSIPAVFLNYRNNDIAVDSVMPDNAGGIREAVARLFSLGHRKIAFFSMNPFNLHTEERFKGYCEGMKKCGMEIFPEHTCLPETRKKTVEEIEEAAVKALTSWQKMENKPTALIATGDGYALSFFHAAHRLGIRLPEELSIVGFGNRIPDCYSIPTLSSIEQPMEDMAKKAMALLLERIANPGKPVENIVLGTRLIERESICENRRIK